MIPSIEASSDSEMKTDTINPRDETRTVDLNYYRKLVRTYIDLVRCIIFKAVASDQFIRKLVNFCDKLNNSC